jgi:hypothetical protein
MTNGMHPPDRPRYLTRQGVQPRRSRVRATLWRWRCVWQMAAAARMPQRPWGVRWTSPAARGSPAGCAGGAPHVNVAHGATPHIGSHSAHAQPGSGSPPLGGAKAACVWSVFGCEAHSPNVRTLSQQEIAALAMHVNCTLGAKTAASGAGKGAPGRGGTGPPASAPPPPTKPAAGGAAAAAAGAATATVARKGGKAHVGGAAAVGAVSASVSAQAAALLVQPVQVPQADEDSALASLQWVLSTRPDAAVAAQQLRDAWARVRHWARRVQGPRTTSVGSRTLLFNE